MDRKPLRRTMERSNNEKSRRERREKFSAGLTKAPPLPEHSSLLKPKLEVKDVPGSEATGTASSVLCLFNIKATGHNYMKKMMQKYNSTVFRMNFFGPRITVCDDQGMQSLYNEELIEKEARFGTLVLNTKIFRGHTPFEYTNGLDHDRKRDFMVDYLHVVKEDWNMSHLLLTIEEEFRMIGRKVFQEDQFEDVVANAMCNIVCRSMIGCTLDYDQVRAWFQHILVPVFKLEKWDSSSGIEACEHLAKMIEESPVATMLASKGRKHDYSKDEITMELLAILLFNAHRSNTGAVISAMIYLKTLTEEQLELLRTEATNMLTGRTHLAALVHIDHFVLEILRLHPPAKAIFGTAREEFIMESQSGNFVIKKGELLCGDIYWTLRNPKVFENPDQFVFERFTENPGLKKYMCAFGGNYYDSIKSFHKCIGQHFSLTLLKMCVCHLMFCEYVPTCEPRWTGNKITRLPASDKPFTVRNFEYRRKTRGPQGARAPVDITDFLEENDKKNDRLR